MSQKILYLSCHSILEYDEVKLFQELGYDIFSPGAYVEPTNPGDPTMRPSIPSLSYNKDIVNQYHSLGAKNPGKDGKDVLTKEFVDNFDIVIVMHIPRWIENNWEAIKHKRVIWRTIGQSISNTELQISPYRDKGLQIVRYSPKERTIPCYIGEDALIRFYKDPNEFTNWNGKDKKVISFAQAMKSRGDACNYKIFEEATRNFPRALFGPHNDIEIQQPWAFGKIPYEQMKEEMRNNRVYFYTGTHPASYTLNFIEAAMTGMPMVAVGKQFGSGKFWLDNGHDLYEVDEILEHKATGLISDDIKELTSYCKFLLNNDAAAKTLSQQVRETAIKYFGKETIKEQWKNFLG
jgi:hypothetical protein